MIHILAANEKLAINIADEMLRKESLPVKVYKRRCLGGYLVMDGLGVEYENREADNLEMHYDPERRSEPRVSFATADEPKLPWELRHAE